MLTKHTLAYFFSHGIPGIITFLSLAVFTRMLTPEEYGIYAIIFVLATFINSVIFQWLRLSFLRYYPAHEEKIQSQFLKSTIVFSFVILVITTAVISIIGAIIFADHCEFHYIYIGLGVVLAWTQAWLALNLTLQRSRLSPLSYGVTSFVRAVLSFLFGVLLIYLGFGPAGILIGMILGFGLSTVYPTYKYWGNAVNIKFFDSSLLKQFLNYGIPLTFSFTMGFIIHSTDRIFINWMINSEATGIYAAGYDLAEKSLITLMTVINLAAYPLVVRAYEKKGRMAASKQLKKNVTLLLAVSFPGLIGFVTLSDNVSQVLLGSDFAEGAAQIIPWIALAAFLKGIKLFYVDLSFQLSNKTNIQIIPVVIGAISNIVLNLLFIPIYGMLGAAYAAVIAYIISIIIGSYLGRKYFKILFPYKSFFKILLASTVMFVVLFQLNSYSGLLSLIVQVILGSIVYFGMCYVLNLEQIRHRLINIFKNGFKDRSKGI